MGTATGVCFSTKGWIAAMGKATVLRSDADLLQIDLKNVIFIGRGILFSCVLWIGVVA